MSGPDKDGRAAAPISTWVFLLPIVLGPVLGALSFCWVFAIPQPKYFLFGAPPFPEDVVKQAKEKARKWAIEEAKALPQDRFWRSYAGPWSDLDRIGEAGRYGLAGLGAFLGGVLGGCVALIGSVVSRRRIGARNQDILPWLGLCFGMAVAKCSMNAFEPGLRVEELGDALEFTISRLAWGALLGVGAGYVGRLGLQWVDRRKAVRAAASGTVGGHEIGVP